MIDLEFINDCLKYSHHDDIKPIPKKFSNWRNNDIIKNFFYDWIISYSNVPSLKIDVDVPYEDIMNEVLDNFDFFVPHRDNELNQGWYSMCIHGISTEKTNAWQYYGYTEEPEYNWTALAEKCPISKEFLENVLSYKFYKRVRFMLLKPGGYIAKHKDIPYRGLEACNIAINNPKGCNFFMENANCIPWQPGDVRFIDIGRYHYVVNDSKENRIHMIIHGQKTDLIKYKVCDAFEKISNPSKIFVDKR